MKNISIVYNICEIMRYLFISVMILYSQIEESDQNYLIESTSFFINLTKILIKDTILKNFRIFLK